MEEKLLFGTVSLNWTHLISADVVDAVIICFAVDATADIVWLHAVPLNF